MDISARPALLLGCCLVLLGCHRHRDDDLSQLGPPSHRLVGHWADDAGDELYYGPLDATSGTGDYFMIHPDGRRFHHHYQLLNEELSSQTAVVNLLFADGDSRPEADVISADGNVLTAGTSISGHYATEELKRVDNATVPPKAYY